MKTPLKIAGVNLLVLAGLLCLIEIGLRVTERAQPFSAGEVTWLIRNAYMGWVNNPGTSPVPIRQDGRRDIPTIQSAPAVLCVGDSGTFGYWRDNDDSKHFDSYPERLAAYALVENAGVMGYSSFHAVRTLIADRGKSKVVVVRIGWNDHAREAHARTRAADSRMAALLSHSAIGRRLLTAALEPSGELRPYVTENELRENIEAMARIAKQNGQRLIVLDYPVRLTDDNIQRQIYMHGGLVKTRAELHDLHARYQSVIEFACRANGVEFVRTPLTDDCFSEVDPVHPNAHGYQRIAEAVARVLNFADGSENLLASKTK